MNIYISHSTSYDYERELYVPLKNSLLYNLYSLTFPHERSSEPFSTKEYFDTCDLVIADVSYPSTGQGIELGWASMMKIPIIAIHRKSAPISSSISVVTSQILGYHDIKEAIELITPLIASKRSQ